MGYRIFDDEKKNAAINHIIDYVKIEEFFLEHLNAIDDIVVRFNLSEESENEIFEFVQKLKRKYL